MPPKGKDGADLVLGILAALAAAVWAWPTLPALWVSAWVGAVCASHVGFYALRYKTTRMSEFIRQAFLTGLWGMALVATVRYPQVMFGVALAASLTQACSTLTARLLALRSATAFAHEHIARAEAETAFLQAVEEIRRLRIDIKTTADVQQQLTAALDESASELNLVRSKADALAATLQRVMPFDPETGLLNAAKFETVLQREWLRMQRQEFPLTLVLIKLDNFEQFEKAYGRVLYEAVLRRVAEIFQKAGTRPGDIAARLGTDQFALLFPETEERHALLLAEEVRVRVRQLQTPNRHAPQSLLTVSIGVATVVPHKEAVSRTLRERAEGALYEATFQGGNRCVRNRIAGFARLERWNIDQDGLITLEGLRHKLALSGYQGQSRELRPGVKPRERRINKDSVEAVVAGMLKVTLDGEIRTLRPGDCLYLPKGVTAIEEVVGSELVLCLEGVKA